jgi:hypothetical protein
MATKKKAKKRTSGKKTKSVKKPARKERAAKKVTKRKKTPRRAALKKSLGKQRLSRKTAAAASDTPRRKGPRRAGFSSPGTAEPHSGEQAGDLQGLSTVESADSESVDELMEEGNAFEAGVVSGVEDAGQREGKEVRTREVLEDDVPEEYLDQD